MDKLATKNLGGFPFVLDDIRQFLGRLTSPANHGIYQAFNNILGGFGTDFIIQGCVASGAPATTSITEGWILLNGELIKVDAQGPFDIASDNTFTKVTTFDSRGNKQFLNGSIADTYEKNRGVIIGSAGSLAFDGNTFFALTNQADLRDDSPAEAGIITLSKKIIEIGAWNMDATDQVFVNHGLADFTKVRSVTVLILNDAGSGSVPINGISSGGVLDGGGVEAVNSVNVALRRVSGGFFDGTPVYDDPSINRGFITIELES